MEESKLIDRDPDEFIIEVFRQDLLNVFNVEDKIARIEKTQKDLITLTEKRKLKFDQLYGTKRKTKRRTFSNATHLSSTDPDARVAKK